MDSKLKSLKVVELKAILSKASVSCPAKANKQEIIARIIANQLATQIYHQLYPEKFVSLSS
jgi:SAP domain-containing ribonucleoprotein